MNTPIEILPKEIQKYIGRLERHEIDNIEEVRLHSNGEITIKTGIKLYYIHNQCDGEFIKSYLNRLLKYSYHSYEDCINQGYITLDCGVRVGLCGKTNIQNGHIYSIDDISSLNIRFAKEVIGCSKNLINSLFSEDGIKSTLIISPPGCGKTTLLRDITRSISYQGYQVSVCDERSEICAMSKSMSSYDIGPNTDVLDRCPKSIGVTMLLRSMSPNVIVTDEIGSVEDATAIRQCLNSGVAVITTIHGRDTNDILSRNAISPLLEEKIFKHVIALSNKPCVGTVVENYDL